MKTIGLDIGGTTIKGAAIEDDKIIYKAKLHTNAQEGKDAVIKTIIDLLDILTPYGGVSCPVGIGSAGDINPYTGKVVYATDSLPGFTGLELKKIIEKITSRKVTVLNDAAAALIGEMHYGAAIGKSDVVMMTLGTGLGGGIAVNGRLLTGANFQSSRLGHIPLHPGERQCRCGKNGCAEQYVSATALIKNAMDAGVKSNDCTTIMKLAYEKDSGAASAVNRFLDDLNSVIETIINIFDPQLILLGGGLTELKEYWWDLLEKKLSQKAAHTVKPAQLGNDAGFFGSQYAALNKNIF